MAKEIQIKPEIIESLKSSIESLSTNIVSLNKNLEDVISLNSQDTEDGLAAENAKEQRTIFTNMLKYLKKISESNEKKKKEDDKGLGKWALLLGGALGLIIAAIQAKVKAFVIVGKAIGKVGKLIFSGIKLVAKAFDSKFLNGTISKAIGKFVSTFKSVFSSLSKFVSGIGKSKGVQLFTKGIKSVLGFVTKVGKALLGFAQFIGKAIGGVIKTSKAVMGFFGNIAGSFSKFGTLVGNIARIAGKIFLPITLIMAAFEGIKEAIDGFQSDGIIGGLTGFIKGVINSVIMKPLDLLKDIVSWILDKLGFDNASEALDSFSFEEIFSSIVDTIMGWYKGAINWVKEKFTNVKDAIGAFFGKKPTEIEAERDEARMDYETTKATAETGAMGKNEDGERVQFRRSVNGVPDRAGAMAQMKSEGYTEMTPDEIKAEVAEERANYDKAQDRLDRYNARPSLAKILSPDSGLAENLQPAAPQGGDVIAGASSEVDSLKTMPAASNNNVAVSSPTTNISNSTNNNLIKPPVRNVDPSLNQYYRNKFQMAL